MEVNGERNRGLYVVKSRGMAHSNQVREFVLTHQGVKLVHVYLGAAGVLTGSARMAQEQREQEEDVIRKQDLERQKLSLQSKRQAMEGQITALRAQFVADQREAERVIRLEQRRQERAQKEQDAMARSRKAGREGTANPVGSL
jgi:circadian clock protein KaiC